MKKRVNLTVSNVLHCGRVLFIRAELVSLNNRRVILSTFQMDKIERELGNIQYLIFTDKNGNQWDWIA